MSTMKKSPPPERSVDDRRAGAITTGCIILMGLSLIGFVLAAVVIGLNLWGVSGTPPAVSRTAGSDDSTSPERLLERRERAEARLSGYGWIDEAGSVVRIPIEQAMADIAATGLPVGTAGIETPTPTPTPTPIVPPTETPVPVESDETPAATPIPEPSPTATPSPSPTIDLANVSFQEHVLPIFEQHCIKCHGGEQPEGGVRVEEGLILRTVEDVLNGSWNGPVVEPGNVEDSYLIEQMVTGRMPKEGPSVPTEQIEVVEAWVESGAPDN